MVKPVRILACTAMPADLSRPRRGRSASGPDRPGPQPGWSGHLSPCLFRECSAATGSDSRITWPALAAAVIGGRRAPIGPVPAAGSALACFAVGGLLYAPYPAPSATLFQRETAWLGPQETLLATAAATIATGLAATESITARRRRAAPRDTR